MGKRHGHDTTPAGKRAQHALQYAVKRGSIQRPPGKIGHHRDHRRPYLVAWVTRKEHAEIHDGERPPPAAHDYSGQVQLRPYKRRK